MVVHEGIVVQSVGFEKYLPVGKPKIAVEFLNYWGIDEIILVNIDAVKNKTGPDYDMVRDLSNKCYVPLTVGGGIQTVDQIKKLMDCGADKVAINHSAIYEPDIIINAANIFGNQCVVVSIDAKNENGFYRVFDSTNRKTIDRDVVEWSKKAELLGAGEIFLTSVDRDGSYLGYDIELMKRVSENIKIPVIASGGAKNAEHFVQVFTHTSVSAASAANLFHFTEHSVITLKAELMKKIDVRLDTAANYSENAMDKNNRLLKKGDEYLEKLLYIRIEKEVI